MSHSRRVASFALVLGVTALSGTANAQPAELPPPQSQPTSATAVERLSQLAKTPTRDLSRNDLALRTGLEFCIAIGAADGGRAATAVDAVGYQALPLEGRLPDAAQKPISITALTELISKRRPFDTATLPANGFELLSAAETARSFPGVGQWMLPPQDIVIRVSPVEAVARNWVARPACIVVRIRGQRAVVVGGNLLEALAVR